MDPVADEEEVLVGVDRELMVLYVGPLLLLDMAAMGINVGKKGGNSPGFNIGKAPPPPTTPIVLLGSVSGVAAGESTPPSDGEPLVLVFLLLDKRASGDSLFRPLLTKP